MAKPKIIAIANQKGGVGKTTTAINLATTLVAVGRRVLVLDIDGQGNASSGLGVHVEDCEFTTYDVFHGDAKISDVAIAIERVPGLAISPANMDLSGMDTELVDDKKRVFKLREAFAAESLNYDYVLIDCPPSLNILTVNALAAADSVLVPLQAEYFALEGLSQLMRTIKEVRTSLNSRLDLQGIVLTMYDKRNNLSAQVYDDVKANLGDAVYRTIIPRNVRLSEAPSYEIPALLYDPKSAGSIAYQDLAIEFLERENDPLEEVA